MLRLLKHGGLDKNFGLKHFDLAERYRLGFGESAILVVVSVDGSTVGGCAIFPRLQRECGQCALLADLYVVPEHRNYACIAKVYQGIAKWRAVHGDVPLYTLPNHRAELLNKRFLSMDSIDRLRLELRIRPGFSRSVANSLSASPRHQWYRRDALVNSDSKGAQVVWRGAGMPFVQSVLSAADDAQCAPARITLATAETHNRMSKTSLLIGCRQIALQCSCPIDALFPNGVQIDDLDIL